MWRALTSAGFRSVRLELAKGTSGMVSVEKCALCLSASKNDSSYSLNSQYAPIILGYPAAEGFGIGLFSNLTSLSVTAHDMSHSNTSGSVFRVSD